MSKARIPRKLKKQLKKLTDETVSVKYGEYTVHMTEGSYEWGKKMYGNK